MLESTPLMAAEDAANARQRAQGSVAQEVGTSYETRLHAALLEYGLKNVAATRVATVECNDGARLLELSKDLLTDQEQYEGVVVRELASDCAHSFASPMRKQSGRDFTVVLEGARVRNGQARPLVLGIESKLQHTNGSVDEKALPTVLNVLAGRAPYAFVIWEGDGPKSQAYDMFHEVCVNPEPFRQLLRSMTYGRPDHIEGPTEFYFASSIVEFFQQVAAIRVAEAQGYALPYVEWLASVPRPQWLDRRTGGDWIRPSAARKAVVPAPVDTATLPLF